MQLQELYGRSVRKKDFIARVKALAEKFEKSTAEKPDAWYSASGRAEIIGNHTDHNHGNVIVAAISCDVLAAVKSRTDGKIQIFSEGYAPFELDVNDLSVREQEYGKSIALVRGVLKGFCDRGLEVGGFTAYCESTVFRGAGVSSSAAFELLICEILNQLYAGGAVGSVEKAIISQFAENIYFGKPCGLLDQSGIALGGINRIDFKDPSNPEIEALAPLQGYSLVITNTGGSHAKLTAHYVAIKEEMHAVAECFGKQFLRDVPYEEVLAEIVKLRTKVSERAILRALHFYEENARVSRAAQALKEGDAAGFLAQIGESGRSSLECLQNCYVPGSAEQPIALAMHISERIIRDGAVRIHGGGFAGTVLAYLADAEVPGYVAQMEKIFGAGNVFTASVRIPGAVRLNIEELAEQQI